MDGLADSDMLSDEESGSGDEKDLMMHDHWVHSVLSELKNRSHNKPLWEGEFDFEGKMPVKPKTPDIDQRRPDLEPKTSNRRNSGGDMGPSASKQSIGAGSNQSG